MPRVIDQFNIPFWTAVWGRPFKKCEIVEKLIKFFFFGRKIWFVKLWEINSIFETANYCMVSLWKIIIECLAITLKKKFFFFSNTHIYTGKEDEIRKYIHTSTPKLHAAVLVYLKCQEATYNLAFFHWI